MFQIVYFNPHPRTCVVFFFSLIFREKVRVKERERNMNEKNIDWLFYGTYQFPLQAKDQGLKLKPVHVP